MTDFTWMSLTELQVGDFIINFDGSTQVVVGVRPTTTPMKYGFEGAVTFLRGDGSVRERRFASSEFFRVAGRT